MNKKVFRRQIWGLRYKYYFRFGKRNKVNFVRALYERNLLFIIMYVIISLYFYYRIDFSNLHKLFLRNKFSNIPKKLSKIINPFNSLIMCQITELQFFTDFHT